MRWKRGKLRAHVFFKHACLLRFGRGLLKPRQPFVELNQSTLNGFCDGSKDFLKLSRLLLHKHSIDHSQNAQECLSRIHAIRGTFGGTYRKENSGPIHDVPLDPKHLMLIWDTGASFGLTPFRSDFIDYVACTIPVGMLLESTMSSVLERHFISFQIPRDVRSTYLVFLITYLKRMSVYSLPKHTIKCMVVILRSTAIASECC